VRAKEKTRGLLEERVERDAWRGTLDALTRLRDARRAEAEAERRRAEVEVENKNAYMSGYRCCCIVVCITTVVSHLGCTKA